MLDETKKFAIKFSLILFLSAVLTFLGTTSFFYLTVCDFLPGDVVKLLLNSFIFLSACLIIILVTSVSFIFYQLLKSFKNRQQRNSEFFELLLEILSHKFGNFISGLKVNVALLDEIKDLQKMRSFNRIKNSVNYMDLELASLLSRIKDMKNDGLDRSSNPIVLEDLLRRQQKTTEAFFGHLAIPQKKLIVRNMLSRFDNVELAFILTLLLENAFKYSKSTIKIRSGGFKKNQYFFLSNDILPERKRGLGIGLTIAKLISERNSFHLSIKEKDNLFMVLVVSER